MGTLSCELSVNVNQNKWRCVENSLKHSSLKTNPKNTSNKLNNMDSKRDIDVQKIKVKK